MNGELDYDYFDSFSFLPSLFTVSHAIIFNQKSLSVFFAQIKHKQNRNVINIKVYKSQKFLSKSLILFNNAGTNEAYLVTFSAYIMNFSSIKRLFPRYFIINYVFLSVIKRASIPVTLHSKT